MILRDEHDPQLINHLGDLSKNLVFPETPPIADRVASAIVTRRPSIAPITIGLITIALALLAISAPQVRSAMSDALSVIGIEIRPADTPREEGDLLLLDQSLFGRPASLVEATTLSGGELRFPTEALSKTPDAIYLLHEPSGLVSVTFVYAASDDLPQIGDGGVGAILTQIFAPTSEPYLTKFVFEPSPIIFTSGNNLQMQWIEQGELARTDSESGWRSSANVLIWLDGTTGYRLESSLTREESIQIAESMQPVDRGNHSQMTPVSRVSIRPHDKEEFHEQA